MPELPEVETAKNGIEHVLVNNKIELIDIYTKSLRAPIPENSAALLKGKICKQIIRRGKYIILIFSNQLTAVLHLGMSGRIRIYKSGEASAFKREKHDHIVIKLKDKTHIVFHDPRKFGMFYAQESPNWKLEKPFGQMGPEPLENWDLNDFLNKLQSRKSPIKNTLLDQNVVAGIGNIYASEILFYAGVSPLRKSSEINSNEAKEIIARTKLVLKKAIKAGGSTLRDHKQTDGSSGYFQNHFAAYDRENESCSNKKCNGIIKRIIQSGRSSFYCPVCQK